MTSPTPTVHIVDDDQASLFPGRVRKGLESNGEYSAVQNKR
jgi:hypothetical protein